MPGATDLDDAIDTAVVGHGVSVFPLVPQQLRRWVGLRAASDAVDREPAIDDQLDASDVFGLVGREEQRGAGEATSQASPMRPGHCSSRRRTISSALPPYAAMTSAACTIGAFIILGRIEFARIPDRAYWRAMTRVN